MGIWQGPDGTRVEAIVRDDQPCLRVTRLVGGERVLVAYCAGVHEVGRYVDLAKLVPMETGRRAASGRTPA
ncbi:hypothetical protein [Planomonospora venezuelensis]|uniref:Uncharacterized protein n=1 Tax=Planomonospora venezuelensis TaxID=1999 RepID=A0A841D8Z0_PLAVE|nr:hypothetical protein [Planomonospora venezuelensis]MBB5966420.1 hypothetical protein [Planomonospora venezuelensis]GIN02755.1 hypothetical protein Pve01_44130 [Planomonospora venezuelensis]